MTQLTESQIESFAIQLFEHLGCKSLHSLDIVSIKFIYCSYFLKNVVLQNFH